MISDRVMNMQKAYVGRNNTVTMCVYIDCTVVTKRYVQYLAVGVLNIVSYSEPSLKRQFPFNSLTV